MTINIPKTVWLGLAALAVMIFIIVPGMILISTSRVPQAGVADNHLGFYYWFQWAIILGLFAILVPKQKDATKTQWAMAILIPAFVGIGIHQYNQSGWGVSTKQEVIQSNRCSATNDCDTPDIRVFAGQYSAPIVNLRGTCLTIAEFNRSGAVQSDFAEFRRDGAWSVHFANQNDAMRMHVVGNPGAFVEYKISRTRGRCTN